MKFSKGFEKKMQEAFEYFCSLQAEVPKEYTIEKWATDHMSKLVYELLRRKDIAES